MGWEGKKGLDPSPKQVPGDPLIPSALVSSTNGQAGQALRWGLSLPICKLRAWAHSRKKRSLEDRILDSARSIQTVLSWLPSSPARLAGCMTSNEGLSDGLDFLSFNMERIGRGEFRSPELTQSRLSSLPL